MPLLGRHNNATTATTTTGASATNYDGRHVHNSANPMSNQASMGTGAAGAAPVGTGAGYGHTNPNVGVHHPAGGLHAQGHAGAESYANTVQNNEITPVQHFSDGQRTGSANATVGKVEHALGTVLCSQSLKAKGIQKEQQAQAFKVQSAEISEAERLEHEASLRRQRAVDFGADPSNRHLGGGSAQAQEFGGNFGTMGAPGGTGPVTGNASGPAGRML